jgi:hypothetical protein
MPPYNHVVECSADLRRWPYDTHICKAMMGSWSHTNEEINISLMEPGVRSESKEICIKSPNSVQFFFPYTQLVENVRNYLSLYFDKYALRREENVSDKIYRSEKKSLFYVQNFHTMSDLKKVSEESPQFHAYTFTDFKLLWTCLKLPQIFSSNFSSKCNESPFGTFGINTCRRTDKDYPPPYALILCLMYKYIYIK